MSVMEAEIAVITDIVARSIGRVMILVIIYVETFKSDVSVLPVTSQCDWWHTFR